MKAKPTFPKASQANIVVSILGEPYRQRMVRCGVYDVIARTMTSPGTQCLAPLRVTNEPGLSQSHLRVDHLPHPLLLQRGTNKVPLTSIQGARAQEHQPMRAFSGHRNLTCWSFYQIMEQVLSRKRKRKDKGDRTELLASDKRKPVNALNSQTYQAVKRFLPHKRLSTCSKINRTTLTATELPNCL
jgi:hypothetical protein